MNDPRTTPADPGPDYGPIDLLNVLAALLPWLVAAWAVGVMLPGPAGRHVVVTLGVSPFLAAAASRALGLHTTWGIFALAVHRAFTHMSSLLPLVALGAIAAALGATAGGMLADAAGLPGRVLAMPLGALAALPVLWRSWPAAVLTYLVPEEAGVRIHGGRAWRGPGLRDATRLRRLAGSAARTAAVAALFLLWAAVLDLAGGPFGPWTRRLAEAALYLPLLGLLTALAALEAHRMLMRVPGLTR